MAPTSNTNDEPGPQRYRITVQVMLQTWATATREADARDAARMTMHNHLQALAEAGITLTRPVWQSADSPAEAPRG
ncbi:hypothetical protein JNW88_31765 [Micromonospora sp. ATA32]|nr:hypothetical protein [Micromonospora sp. ATA32]